VHTLVAFLKLTRPHFLLGGVLLFALGSATAGSIDRGAYVLGQAMVTAAQVTAHYVNEYFDLEADRSVAHRTMFSGGSGILVAGVLAPTVALRAAWVSTSLTMILVAVVAIDAPSAALLGLVALAVSWAYSAPPLRLLGSGAGEVATSLVVTVVVPLIGSSVQHGAASPRLWWSMAILFSLHMSMMLVFELPDLESDAAAGKRVLAVRLGAPRTRRLIAGLTAAASLIAGVGGVVGGLPVRTAVATLIGLPTAVVVMIANRRENATVATAAAVFTLATVALALTAVS